MKNIPITWLDECDSTSRVLKERVKHSAREPMALAAHRQTAGTGRLGRSWQSIPGNLHISISLPAAEIKENLRDILPLAVAVMVGRWTERFALVRPCLKWPNDILVDGRKVAGILCEGTIQGREFLGAVIGIGINLKKAPELSGAGSSVEDGYPAGALADLVGCVILPEAAAESLVRMFAEEWSLLTREMVFQTWQTMAIRPGHHWVSTGSGSAVYFRDAGLTDLGHLRLETRAGGSSSGAGEILVSSVSHEYKWSGQTGLPFLVADVGNSCVKIGITEMTSTGGIRIRDDIQDFSFHEVPGDFIKAAIAGGASPVIHVVSVNPAGLKAFSESTARFGVDIREVQKSPVRVTKSNYDLSLIGSDRLALLEAALYLQSRGQARLPLICVSLGTATTIDLIATDGTHLGGYIVAGVQTALEALASKGAMLPRLGLAELGVAGGEWPTTTEQAMTQGSIESTAAFIKSERERLASFCGGSADDVSVLLTGGLSGLIAGSVGDQSVVRDPGLVLLGCAILAANGR